MIQAVGRPGTCRPPGPTAATPGFGEELAQGFRAPRRCAGTALPGRGRCGRRRQRRYPGPVPGSGCRARSCPLSLTPPHPACLLVHVHLGLRVARLGADHRAGRTLQWRVLVTTKWQGHFRAGFAARRTRTPCLSPVRHDCLFGQAGASCAPDPQIQPVQCGWRGRRPDVAPRLLSRYRPPLTTARCFELRE